MMKNRILKNTTMLLLMNIAKMFFPLLTLPYLTRVLTVECFGLVAYMKAVMQYMLIFVEFGFLLSGTRDVVLAKNNPERLNQTISEILSAKLIVTICAFLILLILICVIKLLANNVLFTLLSFVVVALSCLLMDFVFRGLEIMEFITYRFVVMKTVSTLLTFVLVKKDTDILWIPGLEIVGSVLAVVWVWIKLRNLGIKCSLKFNEGVINKLRVSSIYFFSDLSTTALTAFNTLLIGIYLPSSNVAFWSVSQQLIGGIQAFFTPITNSVYPAMVREKNIRLIKKVIKISLPCLIVGCFLIFFLSDKIVAIVCGSGYENAAKIIVSLLPMIFMSFFAMLFGWPVLGPIDKAKETSLTTAFAASAQVVGLLLLVVFNVFNLNNIIIVRNIAEILLFSFRFYYFNKFRELYY